MEYHDKDLDELFGRVVTPPAHKVAKEELSKRPSSLSVLTAQTAAQLLALMRSAESGLGVCQFVYSRIPILWIADRHGEIRIAVEEVYERTELEYLGPRATSYSLTVNEFRLGHPSLLDDAAGRIAGEIIFDTGDDMWKITNSSGRYGLRPGRSEAHLRNVCTVFRNHGIVLVPSFVEPMA